MTATRPRSQAPQYLGANTDARRKLQGADTGQPEPGGDQALIGGSPTTTCSFGPNHASSMPTPSSISTALL